MHYIYILYSSRDRKLYFGYTNNLRRRIQLHKEGKVFATKARLPVKMIYCEAFLSEADARARERYFKTGWGRNYVKKHLANTLKLVRG